MTDPHDDPAPGSLQAATRALDRAAALLIALMLVASAAVYHALPAMLATHWGADGAVNGWTPRLPGVLLIPALGVGVLLLVLGNVTPRVRPNYFVGIRTPWTLASDAVWARTHRVGGYLLAGAGLVTLGAGLLGGPYALPAATTAATAAALGSVVYSYAARRREAADAHPSTRPRP